MTETSNRVPGVNESDPDNVRMRSFQGGANGIGPRPTVDQTFGQMKYEDGDGAFAGLHLPNGLGSGLSGLPEANAGIAPALWDDPQAAPGATGPQQGKNGATRQ